MVKSLEDWSNLQSLTGNGDISLWVKNSQVGQKSQAAK